MLPSAQILFRDFVYIAAPCNAYSGSSSMRGVRVFAELFHCDAIAFLTSKFVDACSPNTRMGSLVSSSPIRRSLFS